MWDIHCHTGGLLVNSPLPRIYAELSGKACKTAHLDQAIKITQSFTDFTSNWLTIISADACQRALLLLKKRNLVLCIVRFWLTGVLATSGGRPLPPGQPRQGNQHHLSRREVWRALHGCLLCLQAWGGGNVRQSAPGASPVWHRCHCHRCTPYLSEDLCRHGGIC